MEWAIVSGRNPPARALHRPSLRFRTKAKLLAFSLVKFFKQKFGQSRNRTGDTRIFSPLLYRLSYLAKSKESNIDSQTILFKDFPFTALFDILFADQKGERSCQIVLSKRVIIEA